MTQRVALLGLGKMGMALADRWSAAGRAIVVWNRTPKDVPVEWRTAQRADSPAAAAALADVVVTMVTDGEALTSITIDQGVIAAMSPGSVLVDLSTIDVASSQQIAAVAAGHGIPYLRGAVTGTPGVVRAGNATLLLSGGDAAYALAQDSLREVAATHYRLGDGEQARVVKIGINSMLGATMQALAEAVTLAEASGIPREVFLDAMDATGVASRFTSNKGAMLRQRDYGSTFDTKDMLKDLQLACDQADAVGVRLSVGSAVRDQLRAAVEAGFGTDDFVSLARLAQVQSGRTPDA